MDVISMKDIRKSYAMGDSVLNVLKGIDLTVKEGEFLAILGPSGSGIFQKYHLIQKYTVLRNVMMPLLLRGLTSSEAEAAARERLIQLGMGERMDHKPHELSGGQQQRAAIARALVGNPKLLLADEPTGALDSATGKEVLKLFGELNQKGHTIVMITHDLNVAKSAGMYHTIRPRKLIFKLIIGRNSAYIYSSAAVI